MGRDINARTKRLEARRRSAAPPRITTIIVNHCDENGNVIAAERHDLGAKVIAGVNVDIDKL